MLADRSSIPALATPRWFTPHQPNPRYTRRRRSARADMIDNFALGLSHGLMLLAAFLLLRRADLDHEPGPHDPAGSPKKRRWGKPGA